MKRFFLALLTLTTLANLSFAQSWMLAQQHPNSDPGGSFRSVHPIDGGGFLLGGWNNWTNSNSYGTPYLVRLDDQGSVIWENTYPTLNLDNPPFTSIYDSYDGGIYPATDGGFFGIFDRIINPSGPWVFKIDALGNLLWSIKFQHPLGHPTGSLLPLSDGGMLLKAENFQLSTSQEQLQLIRLDSLGNTVYDSTYNSWHAVSGGESAFMQMAPENDAFYLIESIPGDSLPLLAKFDLTGNLQWEYQLENMMSGFDEVACYDMQIAPDSGIVIGLRGQTNAASFLQTVGFHKCDRNGSPLWNNLTNVSLLGTPSLIMKMSITQSGDILTLLDNAYEVGRIVKFDSGGIALWNKIIGDTASTWSFYDIEESQSRGIALAGAINYRDIGFALHLDSLAEDDFNLIQGIAYSDTSGDCNVQPDETLLGNWLVQIEPDNLFTTTGFNGEYELKADSGNHWVSISPPALLWADLWSTNCPSNPDSHYVSFTGVVNPDTADGIDFAMVPDVYCPLMYVDITTPVVRRCASATYTVSYNNFGTIAADSVYIDVTFDSTLTYQASSFPSPPTIIGNIYRFYIGTVQFGASGSFNIITNVACDSLNPGRTHCAVAHIYPDSLCTPPDPAWSGASLGVEGECILQDSIKFTITNNGTAAMLGNSGVWVVEDDILFYQGTVNLGAGQDTSFSFLAKGATWACIVDQVPNHPGQSLPRAIVEGCGTNTQGLISTGFASQFGEDDLDHFISIDCRPDIFAYDPNDKQGTPTGVGNQHRIFATDEMEYTIRFQNTGNDTAFRVVLRDEIPTHLDLSTFIQGPSSHPFNFQIINGRTLEWTYDPIQLPDSNTNFDASQGFVKFSIRQVPNNPIGTRIENEAAIYFDFNAPVITNTTWHTIGEDFEITVDLDEAEPLAPHAIQLLVYPNPFSDQVTFELEDYHPQSLRLEVFDLQGRLIRSLELGKASKFNLYSEGLGEGMYPFRLTDAGHLLQTGKLIVRNP